MSTFTTTFPSPYNRLDLVWNQSDDDTSDTSSICAQVDYDSDADSTLADVDFAAHSPADAFPSYTTSALPTVWSALAHMHVDSSLWCQASTLANDDESTCAEISFEAVGPSITLTPPTHCVPTLTRRKISANNLRADKPKAPRVRRLPPLPIEAVRPRVASPKPIRRVRSTVGQDVPPPLPPKDKKLPPLPSAATAAPSTFGYRLERSLPPRPLPTPPRPLPLLPRPRPRVLNRTNW